MLAEDKTISSNKKNSKFDFRSKDRECKSHSTSPRWCAIHRNSFMFVTSRYMVKVKCT